MRRFVLFHEAFHILLRRNFLPNLKQEGIPRGTFSEYLADAFASYILLPEKLVREKWEKVRDTNIMSSIFKVPKTTVCIRLRRLGLI